LNEYEYYYKILREQTGLQVIYDYVPPPPANLTGYLSMVVLGRLVVGGKECPERIDGGGDAADRAHCANVKRVKISRRKR